MKNIKELATKHVNEIRLGLSSAILTGSLLAPTMCSYAADASGGDNLLTGEVMAAIQTGFSSLAITATAVVALSVVTGVSIVGISSASKYAMKKIKTTLSSAQ